MTDAALTPAARLVEAHCRELWRGARRRGAQEDHAQEALLRALTGAPAEVRRPQALLMRILRNVSIDAARRGARERAWTASATAAALGEASPDAERVVAAREELRIVIAAVAELPPRCRQCFVMRRFDDLDQHEIARRMGVTVNMVEKHLRRATLHCAERLRAAR